MSAPFVVAAVLLLMLPFRTAFCAAQRGSLVILEAVVNEGDVILRYGNGFWSPFFGMCRRAKSVFRMSV